VISAGVLAAAALAMPRLLAAQQPADAERRGSVDSVVGAARAAAQASRNAEAARLFGEAVRLDPARRGALRRELADQLTYSERARAAVPLYREHLTTALDPDESRRTRLGLALALSWSGQLAEAQRAYAAVLADDPGNRDAERGLARVLVWRGRHRAAQARLAALLARDASDAEARLLLAQSERGMGRPDRALGTLGALVARGGDAAGAERLRREVLGSLRAGTRVDYQRSTQSDALGIGTLSVTHAVPLGARAAVEPRYDERRFEPARAPLANVVVRRPSASGRVRLSDAFELNVAPGVELIDGGPAGRRRTVAVYDAWLTYWPGDRARIDLSSGRSTFDNVRSLLNGLAQTSVGLSADLLPDEHTRLALRTSAASVSDGNHRVGGQVEVEREVVTAPHVYVGARAEQYRFGEARDAGYFSPTRYGAALVTARAWAGVANRLYWNVDGAYGAERAAPGGGRPRWSVGGRLNYLATTRVEFEGRYSYFSSRQLFGPFGTALGATDPSAGFSRGTGGVAARLLW
jgi:thioredoxin-like negative regulator of GroEL